LVTSAIDPRVIAVIKAWVTADDVEGAPKALKQGRLGLDAELVPVLVQEVAAITAETMVEVIAMEKGLDGDVELVEVEGLNLHPKQVERLSAWANDLEPTADALGVSGEQFTKRLGEAMDALSGAAEAEGGERATKIEAAKKLLGSDGGTFENPPDAASEQSGLSGRLAALNFQKK
jgi:hypothetical protein